MEIGGGPIRLRSLNILWFKNIMFSKFYSGYRSVEGLAPSQDNGNRVKD